MKKIYKITFVLLLFFIIINSNANEVEGKTYQCILDSDTSIKIEADYIYSNMFKLFPEKSFAFWVLEKPDNVKIKVGEYEYSVNKRFELGKPPLGGLPKRIDIQKDGVSILDNLDPNTDFVSKIKGVGNFPTIVIDDGKNFTLDVCLAYIPDKYNCKVWVVPFLLSGKDTKIEVNEEKKELYEGFDFYERTRLAINGTVYDGKELLSKMQESYKEDDETEGTDEADIEIDLKEDDEEGTPLELEGYGDPEDLEKILDPNNPSSLAGLIVKNARTIAAIFLYIAIVMLGINLIINRNKAEERTNVMSGFTYICIGVILFTSVLILYSFIADFIK